MYVEKEEQLEICIHESVDQRAAPVRIAGV